MSNSQRRWHCQRRQPRSGAAVVADLLAPADRGHVQPLRHALDRPLPRTIPGGVVHWEAVNGADFARVSGSPSASPAATAGIDFLVNNMAVGSDGLLILPHETDIHRQIALNVESTVLLTRACLKVMLAERSGAIVNISSINALRGHQGVSVYSDEGRVDRLDEEPCRRGRAGGDSRQLRGPGLFRQRNDRRFHRQQRQRIVRRTPLRRLGTVADVAAAVRFFLYSPRQVSSPARFLPWMEGILAKHWRQ